MGKQTLHFLGLLTVQGWRPGGYGVPDTLPCMPPLPCLVGVPEKKSPLLQSGSCVQRQILPKGAGMLRVQCWICAQCSSSSQTHVGLSAHPLPQHMAVYALRTSSVCCEQPERCSVSVSQSLSDCWK